MNSKQLKKYVTTNLHGQLQDDVGICVGEGRFIVLVVLINGGPVCLAREGVTLTLGEGRAVDDDNDDWS